MSPLNRRVACSLAILFGYHWLSKIPLPFLRDLSASTSEPLPHYSIFALGLGPFLASFLLVELYGLLTPWGRRLRRGGLAGRHRMNQLGLRLGIVTAAVQATVMVMGLSAAVQVTDMVLGLSDPRTVYGPPLPSVPPGWEAPLVLIGTLTAGAFLTFFVCQALTRYGLGNGFCQIFIYLWLGYALWPSDLNTSGWNWNAVELGAVPRLVLWFAFIAAIGVLLHRLERPRDQALASLPEASRDTTSEPLPLLERFPIHPQGLIAVSWTASLLSLFYHYIDFSSSAMWLGGLSDVFRIANTFATYAVIIPLLSWITLQLFSTRSRVETHLPSAVSLPDGYERSTRHRFWISVWVWTMLHFAEYMLFNLFIFRNSTWWLPNGVFTVACLWFLAFDLRDEWRFRSQHRAERVVELDNVHLATYLELRLRQAGIPCLMQGYRFRSLFFFLAPLFKISLMVPEGRKTEAKALVEGVGLEVV